jgi:hypothetical protein
MREVTSRMPTTVNAADAERKPNDPSRAEKSAATLNYEEMLAALNAVLAEMRDEERQTHSSCSFGDAEQDQERATAQPSVWAEAHAMLAQK